MDDDFDHNPFAKPVPTQEVPPSDTNSKSQLFKANMSSQNKKGDGNMTEELERRQKELDAKAAELARREAEQNRIAQEQTRHQSTDYNWSIGERKKNFPPLPKFFPCAPCFYVNIDQEIPEQHRVLVRHGFRLWMAYSVLTVVNFIGAIIYLAGAPDKTYGGPLLGTAMFGLVILPPMSFVFWFLPLYKAFKTDSSINFFIFFAIMSAQIVVMILQFAGLFNFGVCGFGYLVSVGSVPWLFAIVFIIAMTYVCVTAFAAYILKKVHFSFRHSEANFNKAKSELFTNFASDPSFRNVAANLVAGQSNTNNQNSTNPQNMA